MIAGQHLSILNKLIWNDKNIVYLISKAKFMLPKPKIYSIKVSGIKCTNCAGKIKNALDQLLDQQFTKVTVNIMQ